MIDRRWLRETRERNRARLGLEGLSVPNAWLPKPTEKQRVWIGLAAGSFLLYAFYCRNRSPRRRK